MATSADSLTARWLALPASATIRNRRGRAKEPWWGTVIEAPDPHALAVFYSELLGWPVVDEGPGGAAIKPPESFVYLGFQTATDFIPPQWPAVDGSQRMTMHLDFEVEDLPLAVADAVALGATLASFQPQENVRVLLDPAGHPFCLYVDASPGPTLVEDD